MNTNCTFMYIPFDNKYSLQSVNKKQYNKMNKLYDAKKIKETFKKVYKQNFINGGTRFISDFYLIKRE